jgi:hypothetical protein
MAGMDVSEHPRSRWWHSTEWNVLISLAIIAALGVGYVGWQASIVWHRQTVRAQLKASGAICSCELPVLRGFPMYDWMRDAECDGIPEIRRLLGDKEVNTIHFPGKLTGADRIAIESFPEAAVTGIPDSPASPLP